MPNAWALGFLVVFIAVQALGKYKTLLDTWTLRYIMCIYIYIHVDVCVSRTVT